MVMKSTVFAVIIVITCIALGMLSYAHFLLMLLALLEGAKLTFVESVLFLFTGLGGTVCAVVMIAGIQVIKEDLLYIKLVKKEKRAFKSKI